MTSLPEEALSDYLGEPSAGIRIHRRCDEWAAFSVPGSGVTRLYLSAEHKQAARRLIKWMEEAGLDAGLDAAGNVVGRYHSQSGGGPYLILGSHQDSVIDGGKYDGPLGVLTALDCVAVLNGRNRRFPFGIEVVAFGDEEGSRFKTTLTGSRAVVGDFGDDLLNAIDPDGVSMADAFKAFGLDISRIAEAAHRPDDVAGYVEIHIEQGPVLESEDLPIGVVTGISGQKRAWIHLHSEPNHAGTVPMALRRDALACACEVALIIESSAEGFEQTVATVGSLEVDPGLANVIPGNVSMSLDLRSWRLDVLELAFETIRSHADAIARRRGVRIEFETQLDLAPCPCAESLVEQLSQAVGEIGIRPIRMPSGAGHDGMAMSRLTDIGMMFVRCRHGISHNPAEFVTPEDIDVAARAILQFVENFQVNRSN